MRRLGVVSFLNSRPLVEGLAQRDDVDCRFEVPALLAAHLDAGDVDAALVPIVDVLRSNGRYRVVSDGCIGCDGETMTVRVFSQMPPDRITSLWADVDSHTSVALARVLWRELYGRDLELRSFRRQDTPLADVDAVLLIGDKVVDPARSGFAFEVDLGGAWRHLTGLPFVFAVWAGHDYDPELATLLSEARDRGVARAAEIAAEEGPRHGWPVELARRYLTRCLRFTLDARARQGVERFAQLCAGLDLVPRDAMIHWPPAKAMTAANSE